MSHSHDHHSTANLGRKDNHYKASLYNQPWCVPQWKEWKALANPSSPGTYLEMGKASRMKCHLNLDQKDAQELA